MKLSPNFCYCEKPHGKSSPLVFQSCDACQDERDKRATDASNGLMSVSCPRCDLQFSADATHSLTDEEREALGEMAEICDSRERLSIHHQLGDEADHWRCRAATVRGILTRTGGGE